MTEDRYFLKEAAVYVGKSLSTMHYHLHTVRDLLADGYVGAMPFFTKATLDDFEYRLEMRCIMLPDGRYVYPAKVAAEYLGVTRQRLNQLVKTRKIKPDFLNSRGYYFSYATLDDYLARTIIKERHATNANPAGQG